jgi:lambda repressor-like predicted transcriptional regulator
MKHVTVWMREKGITVDALEAASGLNRQQLEAIAQGRYLASPQQRQKIAAALGLKPEEISWGHATPIEHMYGF